MQVITLPERVPRRGNAAGRLLGRAMLRAFGWSVTGEIPNLSQLVVAVAPHTSNWDFVIGISAMFALDLRIAFLGKHTIFVGPFAPILRWMGGIPVDRDSPHGVVGEAIAAFAHGPRILAIAPEGTRRAVPHFRTGFLHIARGAGVPVLLAALDYGQKSIVFGPMIEPGEDVEADRVRIEAHFAPIRGKRLRTTSAQPG